MCFTFVRDMSHLRRRSRLTVQIFVSRSRRAEGRERNEGFSVRGSLSPNFQEEVHSLFFTWRVQEAKMFKRDFIFTLRINDFYLDLIIYLDFS